MEFILKNSVKLSRLSNLLRVDEDYGPGGAQIIRRPREDEGSGVLDVLGDGIEPKLCFHQLPNTVSQQYRDGIKHHTSQDSCLIQT
jgi:hypothetical protein